MKIVLLITLVESALLALFMILWRYRSARIPARVPVAAISVARQSTFESRRHDALRDSRWAFINGWKVEPQSDDRAPAFGDVASSKASASAHRSGARRRHQAMYKQWSQDRHD
ncbi:MAG TPA: hypothetical protein VEW46_03465 [Pyrinomonadaceae bacterium]|nr:hypothetical protein [Pyrinomonadaceae bacterium]